MAALVRLVLEASKREAARARRSKKTPGATHGVVLVTSAIGHTTRHLARAAELAEEGHLREAEEMLERTIAQHEQLAATLRLDHEAKLFDRFSEIDRSIASLLEGIA